LVLLQNAFAHFYSSFGTGQRIGNYAHYHQKEHLDEDFQRILITLWYIRRARNNVHFHRKNALFCRFIMRWRPISNFHLNVWRQRTKKQMKGASTIFAALGLGKALYLLLQVCNANNGSGWVCPATKPIAGSPFCFLA
jgi:hypothetical protein